MIRSSSAPVAPVCSSTYWSTGSKGPKTGLLRCSSYSTPYRGVEYLERSGAEATGNADFKFAPVLTLQTGAGDDRE